MPMTNAATTTQLDNAQYRNHLDYLLKAGDLRAMLLRSTQPDDPQRVATLHLLEKAYTASPQAFTEQQREALQRDVHLSEVTGHSLQALGVLARAMRNLRIAFGEFLTPRLTAMTMAFSYAAASMDVAFEVYCAVQQRTLALIDGGVDAAAAISFTAHDYSVFTLVAMRRATVLLLTAFKLPIWTFRAVRTTAKWLLPQCLDTRRHPVVARCLPTAVVFAILPAIPYWSPPTKWVVHAVYDPLFAHVGANKALEVRGGQRTN